MKNYLYIGVSVTIVIIGIFLVYTLQNNVAIQNIQVQPTIIKVGDIFTVRATLVNNSPNPIYVDVSPCNNPVIVDSHVAVDKSEMCPDVLARRIVYPSENFTSVYQDSGNNFKATTAGTTNVIIQLFYSEHTQTIHSNTVSKSFSFTILDK